jgi:hypothetical protein
MDDITTGCILKHNKGNRKSVENIGGNCFYRSQMEGMGQKI